MTSPLTTKAALLQSLMEGDAHGAVLVRRVYDSLEVLLQDGSVYPALTSLVEEGLIEEVQGDSQRNKVFSLTSKGKRAVKLDKRRIAKLCKI